MKEKISYISSLDGIRALAITLVLGYHFQIPFFSGGFIGVDLFFVLSGYLITLQLLKEIKISQTINIKLFWKKRFNRLYPGIFALIIPVIGIYMIKHPSSPLKIIKDALAGILGVSNWWNLIQKVPYADIFTKPSPLKHFWSLAVEAQFYLIFPLLLLVLYKKVKNKKKMLGVLALISLCSIISMSVWYSPTGIDRSYYGTDTRIFSLLFGSMFAFIWAPSKLKDKLTSHYQHILDYTAIVILGILLIMVMSINENMRFLYYGGFVLISLLGVILIGISVHSGTKTFLFFSHPILSWLGKRSYSIYLWHYPIIVLFTPLKASGIYRTLVIILELLLTLVIADISFRLIETPLRKQSVLSYIKTKIPLLHSKKFIYELLFLLVLIVSFWGTNFGFEKHIQNAQEMRSEEKIETPSKQKTEEKIKLNQIIFIGDSIFLGAKNEISKRIPNSIIDGEVGRQFIEGTELIQKKYENNLTTDTLVVIELGTNGLFTTEDVKELYDLIVNKNAHIAFINTRMPLNWQSKVNTTLKKFGKDYPDALIIDWHQYIEDNLYDIENDGIHPKVDAYNDYVAFLINQIEEKYLIPEKNEK